MDGFNNNNNTNENINNTENTTPNYNSQIYSEPVPTPGQFNSNTSYGSNQTSQFNSGVNYTSAPQSDPYFGAPMAEKEEPMSLGEWIGTILLTMIPCVNIVLLFVWAFSSSEKKSKSNWAKAMLIIMAIILVIYIIMVVALVAAGISFLSQF